MAVRMTLWRVNTENRALKEEFWLKNDDAETAQERIDDLFFETLVGAIKHGAQIFYHFKDKVGVDHYYRVDEIRHVSFHPGLPDPADAS